MVPAKMASSRNDPLSDIPERPEDANAPHKTLIIHIGDHKTGSTSIQTAFAKQQVRLAGRTVCYPAKISHNMLKPHCRAYAMPDRPKMRRKAIAVFEKLAGKIRASDADFCLISAEAFETVPPGVLHDIVMRFFAPAADEIRVVGYVRPHAGRLLSSFAERTKIGLRDIMSGTLDSFHASMLADRRLFYHPRFSALRELFGDAFLLRPMIRSELYHGSVVDDFVRHAFGVADFEITGNGQANESLVLEDLMRLKVLQSHLEGRQPHRPRHALGWEFARVVAHLPPPRSRSRLRLHRTLAQDLHEAYLEDARAMDRDFFDGRPLLEGELDAALAGAVEEPQSVDPVDYLSESDMRSLSILSEIIAGMLENEGRKWPLFFYGKRLKEVREAAALNEVAEEGDDVGYDG